MTPQTKKKLSAALMMLLAVVGALMSANQIPPALHQLAAASMTVLGVVVSFLPALFGDVPSAAVVETPPAPTVQS